jgi:UTP--glucose-1-phosphate uridylyltransferase
MKLLGDGVAAAGPDGRTQLSTALARLSSHERYVAAELAGRRYDIGVRYGLWTAQLAIALAGQDRDEVLASLVETLAQAQK